MNLSSMNSEWIAIANSITVYIIRLKSKNEEKLKQLCKNPFELYNSWLYATGMSVNNSDLGKWCLEYINDISSISLHRLKIAADVDNLKY